MRPFGLFQSENQMFRFDVIQGLRAMGVSRRVLTRLETVDDAMLDGVIALGEVNVKRQEHFFRSVILAYVTVPLTIGAIWAQLSPDGIAAFMAGEGPSRRLRAASPAWRQSSPCASWQTGGRGRSSACCRWRGSSGPPRAEG